MLQDQIFATDKWLKTGNNADIAAKFLQATFKGWIYCRDNAQKCVDIVLAKGSQLGASHQAWQMNEINALIWPSPKGIGLLDKALYDQTISIATTYKVLKAAPSADATRTDLAQKALDALGTSVDTKGAKLRQGDGHPQGGRQLAVLDPRDRKGPAREGRPFGFRGAMRRPVSRRPASPRSGPRSRRRRRSSRSTARPRARRPSRSARGT